MRRICKRCKKNLTPSCDYCHSVNVRESRQRPGTFNCGNCFRKHMVLQLKEELCHECEQQLRKERHR